MANFEDLLGVTLKNIAVVDHDERIVIEAEDGRSWIMLHDQNCCESVSVEDITGDLSDLIGSPIVEAEETSNDECDPGDCQRKSEYDDGWTWTFYKLRTAKGAVTIRWYGSSKGYYSTSVSFREA